MPFTQFHDNLYSSSYSFDLSQWVLVRWENQESFFKIMKDCAICLDTFFRDLFEPDSHSKLPVIEKEKSFSIQVIQGKTLPLLYISSGTAMLRFRQKLYYDCFDNDGLCIQCTSSLFCFIMCKNMNFFFFLDLRIRWCLNQFMYISIHLHC